MQCAIDQDGEFARGRGDGLGLADAGGQATIERAERGLRAAETHRGHAQDRGGAIGGAVACVS